MYGLWGPYHEGGTGNAERGGICWVDWGLLISGNVVFRKHTAGSGVKMRSLHRGSRKKGAMILTTRVLNNIRRARGSSIYAPGAITHSEFFGRIHACRCHLAQVA